MSASPLDAGTQLRHRRLGTEAVYRVLGVAGDVVNVEVVRAPGLLSGTRLRLTTDAVHAMERLAPNPDAVLAGGRIPSPSPALGR